MLSRKERLFREILREIQQKYEFPEYVDFEHVLKPLIFDLIDPELEYTENLRMIEQRLGLARFRKIKRYHKKEIETQEKILTDEFAGNLFVAVVDEDMDTLRELGFSDLESAIDYLTQFGYSKEDIIAEIMKNRLSRKLEIVKEAVLNNDMDTLREMGFSTIEDAKRFLRLHGIDEKEFTPTDEETAEKLWYEMWREKDIPAYADIYKELFEKEKAEIIGLPVDIAETKIEFLINDILEKERGLEVKINTILSAVRRKDYEEIRRLGFLSMIHAIEFLRRHGVSVEQITWDDVLNMWCELWETQHLSYGCVLTKDRLENYREYILGLGNEQKIREALHKLKERWEKYVTEVLRNAVLDENYELINEFDFENVEEARHFLMRMGYEYDDLIKPDELHLTDVWVEELMKKGYTREEAMALLDRYYEQFEKALNMRTMKEAKNYLYTQIFIHIRPKKEIAKVEVVKKEVEKPKPPELLPPPTTPAAEVEWFERWTMRVYGFAGNIMEKYMKIIQKHPEYEEQARKGRPIFDIVAEYEALYGPIE